jgi:hypothetical protein
LKAIVTMTKSVDLFGNELKVGDTVQYYDYTHCEYRHGTITEVNCDVLWASPGTVGVKIGSGLTRPYNDIVKVFPSDNG